MKVYRVGDRYLLECDYEDRKIPGSNGWRFDRDTKIWWTDNINNVKKIKKYNIKISEEVLREMINEG